MTRSARLQKLKSTVTYDAEIVGATGRLDGCLHVYRATTTMCFISWGGVSTLSTADDDNRDFPSQVTRTVSYSSGGCTHDFQKLDMEDPPALASLSLTHVHYDPTDKISYISAWLALVPQGLCIMYVTLIWATREVEILMMFGGQMACEALNWGLKRYIKEDRPKRE